MNLAYHHDLKKKCLRRYEKTDEKSVDIRFPRFFVEGNFCVCNVILINSFLHSEGSE